MAKKTDKKFSLTKSNFGGRGWIVILLVLFSIFLQSSIINDSLNVTIPAFAAAHGWNIQLLYMMSTVTAWVAVFAAILWGHLARKSAKTVWAVSLGIVIVTLLVWAQSNNPNRLWLYITALLVASVAGQGFNYTGSYNVINNWFPRKKGLAMGWATIGFPLSALATIPILEYGIMPNLGLSGVYYFYAAFAAVMLVLVLLLVKNYPEQAGKIPDNDKSLDRAALDAELKKGVEHIKTSEWTIKKLLKTGNVWKIGLTFGVFGLIAIGVMTNFMPRALQAGYTEEEVIPMLMITGVVACVGSYLCGILDAKVGPKKASVMTMFLAVVALLVNIIPSKAAMYISLPLIGVLLGGAANYLVSITTTIWGRYDFPNAYRVLLPMNNLVGAMGVAIVGVIGNTEGLGYTVAYAVIAGLALIAAIVMMTIKDEPVKAVDVK